eukprot:10949924-Lingulodinium_polyedra.AAC.1
MFAGRQEGVDRPTTGVSPVGRWPAVARCCSLHACLVAMSARKSSMAPSARPGRGTIMLPGGPSALPFFEAVHKATEVCLLRQWLEAFIGTCGRVGW